MRRLKCLLKCSFRLSAKKKMAQGGLSYAQNCLHPDLNSTP